MVETRDQLLNEDDGAPERRASSLDITPEELSALASGADELVREYFARVAGMPVFPAASAAEIAAWLPVELPAEPESLDALLEDCRRVMQHSRHNGHPRFFGYIASPATPVGAYADLIASALNQNVTAWRSAPAATQIEKTVVRWLASLMGYAEGAGGLLTSGGSAANLNALYVAHRVKAAEALGAGHVALKGLCAAPQPFTLYVSAEAHLSLAKAADVLGLGREQVRVVETDARLRMDVRLLRERIESDLRDGYRPFCVAASAGTVGTGAVDPLKEIASVAREFGLWFHADGAYGAPAALDQSKRALFAGIEMADSVTLDPHKWLYTPVDCGCLLLRESHRARAAWASDEAGYIKVFEQSDDEQFAFWDYGIELSRRFRALKIWLLLRYYGARRVAEAVSEDNRLAAYMAELVRAADDFELLAPVELSICCFRYAPPAAREALAAAATEEERARLEAELDDLNARVAHAVQRGGRAYLSSAIVRGRFALRACVVNFRTTRRDVALTLDVVRDAARAARTG
ncbi:MAG: pyridoxal phosphate-dependent decarboxylase family protein [Pyrinomonadaceae bacterium]